MPAMADSASPRWPGSGLSHLSINAQGWLQATPAWWQHWLQRPELALVNESCRAERALHRALHADPLRPVTAAELDALADDDARENYGHFVALRDGVETATSLEGWYLQQFKSGRVTVPPLFLDLVTQAIVQNLLGACTDPPDTLAWRSAELFFRPQRISFEQGRVLAADSETIAEQTQTQGLGELGRLMAQASIRATPLQLPVLGPEHTARYDADARRTAFRSSLLLDLTHQLTQDLGHGVRLTLGNARSGLKRRDRGPLPSRASRPR